MSPSDEKPGDSEWESSDAAVDVADPLTAEPPKYAVFLHNDDYTTMEFVVEVLKRFFNKTGDEAVAIMLEVHERGKGVAGIYTHEIAETKVLQVENEAQAKGFPLACTMEKVS